MTDPSSVSSSGPGGRGPDPFASVSKGDDAELEVTVPTKTLPGARGERRGEPGHSARHLIATGRGPVDRGVADMLESVIGLDERERVRDTDDYPWRMICSLQIEGPLGAAIGTGWLAGPRTVITAGHCVFHPQIGGWADRVVLRAGRDLSRAVVTLESSDFSTTTAWKNQLDPNFDYAAIHLTEADAAAVERVGWFCTALLGDAELQGRRVNVSGYPADKGGTTQWHAAKQVLFVSPHRLFYDVDTHGGQSGAPVWIQDDPDEVPRVVGIHAYGTGATPSQLGQEANSAPRINQDVFARIQGWVDRDAPGAAA
ncbi:MAG: trypsin-like serine peptidase [Sandaracinaceae bacterium]